MTDAWTNGILPGDRPNRDDAAWGTPSAPPAGPGNPMSVNPVQTKTPVVPAAAQPAWVNMPRAAPLPWPPAELTPSTPPTEPIPPTLAMPAETIPTAPIAPAQPAWVHVPSSPQQPWPPVSETAAPAAKADSPAAKRAARGRYAKGMSGNPAGRPVKEGRELSQTANDQAITRALFTDVTEGVALFDVALAQIRRMVAAGDMRAIIWVIKEAERLAVNAQSREPVLYLAIESVTQGLAKATGKEKQTLQRVMNQLRAQTLKLEDK